MYLIDDMVDMGLPKGVSWPSEFHRVVAQNLLIGNPEIKDMDQLSKGVVNILNIPNEKIKTIKVSELNNYGFQVRTTVGL